MAGKQQRRLGKENVGGCQEEKWWRMDMGRSGNEKRKSWRGKKGTGVEHCLPKEKERSGESCLWEGFRCHSEGLRAGAQGKQKQDGQSFRQ